MDRPKVTPADLLRRRLEHATAYERTVPAPNKDMSKGACGLEMGGIRTHEIREVVQNRQVRRQAAALSLATRRVLRSIRRSLPGPRWRRHGIGMSCADSAIRILVRICRLGKVSTRALRHLQTRRRVLRAQLVREGQCEFGRLHARGVRNWRRDDSPRERIKSRLRGCPRRSPERRIPAGFGSSQQVMKMRRQRDEGILIGD